MAQAPQPPALPQQPTQQQSQRLAVGGLASLGGMQDAQDQGTPTRSGEPVQMLARGGVVAFRDNPDQPVNADIPSDEESTSTAGNFFRGIRDFVKRQQAENLETQRRTRQSGDLSREINQRKPGLFEQLTPTQRAERDEEVKTLEETLQGYRNMGTAPLLSRPVPAVPAADPVKPSDLTVSQGGGPDFAALLRQVTGGGGGSPNLADFRKELAEAKKPTEEETEYRNLVKEQMRGIRNRQSPEVSEADRKRIIGEQFAQNQATSQPHYEKMQKMIDEERASTKERYADSASNARLRLGLGLLGSRAPGFGQALSEAATPALDYYDKAKELEAAANSKTRQADMDLIKARMSDEKGDRESAQRYFDSYQRNKREAETYEIQRSNMLISAQKGVVDVEGKRDRSAMTMQLNLDRAEGSARERELRSQLGLAKLMAGNQPKPLTINEKLAVEKRASEAFGNPASPEFQKYVGAAPNGKQLLVDLKNGRIKPDNPQFQDIVSQAKRRYTQDLMGGTRSSSGPTSYDQAASDLLGQ
jgi:hypothetical protein